VSCRVDICPSIHLIARIQRKSEVVVQDHASGIALRFAFTSAASHC